MTPDARPDPTLPRCPGPCSPMCCSVAYPALLDPDRQADPIDARRGMEDPPRWHLSDPAAFPPPDPDVVIGRRPRIRRALCGVALSRFAEVTEPHGLDMCPDCQATPTTERTTP